MTDEEIDSAIARDPDAAPASTEDQLRRAKLRPSPEGYTYKDLLEEIAMAELWIRKEYGSEAEAMLNSLRNGPKA